MPHSRWLLLPLALMLLTACGQKGPLYRSEEAVPTEAPSNDGDAAPPAVIAPPATE